MYYSSQDATYANAQRSHFQTAIWSTAGDDQKRRWRESPLLECLPQLVDSLSIYRPEEAAAPSRKSSRARQPPEVGEAEEAEASGPPPMVTRVELGRIEIYRTRWMMAALTKEKEDAQAEVNKARKKLLAIDRALGQDEGTANGTRHKRLEKQLKALAGTELWRITGVGPVVLRGMQRSSGVSSLLAKSGLADRRTVQTVKEIATTCNKLCQSTSEACSGNLTVNEIKSQLLVELSSQWGRGGRTPEYVKAVALLKAAYEGSLSKEEDLRVMTGARYISLPYTAVSGWQNACGRYPSKRLYTEARQQLVSVGGTPLVDPLRPLTAEEKMEMAMLSLEEEEEGGSSVNLVDREDASVLALLSAVRTKKEVLLKLFRFISSPACTTVTISRASRMYDVSGKKGSIFTKVLGVAHSDKIYLNDTRLALYQRYLSSLEDSDKKEAVSETYFRGVLSASCFHETKAKGACDSTNHDAYEAFEDVKAIVEALLSAPGADSRLSSDMKQQLEAAPAAFDRLRYHLHKELPQLLEELEGAHDVCATHCSSWMLADRNNMPVERHYGYGDDEVYVEEDQPEATVAKPLSPAALHIDQCPCKDQEHKLSCRDCNLGFSLFALIDRCIHQIYADDIASAAVKELLLRVDEHRITIQCDYIPHLVRGAREDFHFDKRCRNLQAHQALALIDYLQKINPEKHREKQEEYYGKRGMIYMSIMVHYMDPATHELKHLFFDYVSDTILTEDAYMSCSIMDCFGHDLLKELPHIQELQLVSDNGPHYHASLFIDYMAMSWSPLHGIRLSHYWFLEAGYGHKGVDVHAGHARAKMRRRFNVQRKDLWAGEDIVEAVQGLRHTTIHLIQVKEKPPKMKVKGLPDISTISEVEIIYGDRNDPNKPSAIILREQTGYNGTCGNTVTRETVQGHWSPFNIMQSTGASVVVPRGGEPEVVDAVAGGKRHRRGRPKGDSEPDSGAGVEDDEKDDSDYQPSDDESEASSSSEGGEDDGPDMTCPHCGQVFISRKDDYERHLPDCKIRVEEWIEELQSLRAELSQAITIQGRVAGQEPPSRGASADKSNSDNVKPPEKKRLNSREYHAMRADDVLGMARKRKTTLVRVFSSAEKKIMREAYIGGIGKTKASADVVAKLLNRRTAKQVKSWWSRNGSSIEGDVAKAADEKNRDEEEEEDRRKRRRMKRRRRRKGVREGRRRRRRRRQGRERREARTIRTTVMMKQSRRRMRSSRRMMRSSKRRK